MEQEISTDDTFQEFDFYSLIDSPGEVSVDVVQESDPKAIKRDSSGFIIAGLLSLLAGVGLIAVTNFNIGLTQALPYLIGAGIAGLGFGLIKGFRRIFRRKNLNLPSLTLRRKVRPKTQNTQNSTGSQSQSRNKANVKQKFREKVEAFKGKRLQKSLKNKVIMGVAGGLAEYSGISVGLVRLLFLMAFFFSGGIIAVIYFILGFVLPTEEPQRVGSPRGGNR